MKLLRSLLLFALAICGLKNSATFASPVPWHFEGTIHTVQGTTELLPPSVNVGDRFFGTLTWDSSCWEYQYVQCHSLGPEMGFRFTVGEHSFSSEEVEVSNFGNLVQFVGNNINATIDGVPVPQLQRGSFQPTFLLSTYGGLPLNPAGLAEHLAGFKFFGVQFSPQYGNALSYYGELDTVNLAPNYFVPEPSTIALIAMALLSLFGFGMMRRRAEA